MRRAAGVDTEAPLAAARHLGAVGAAAGGARPEHVHLCEPAQGHRQLGHHHHASVLDTWVGMLAKVS